MSDVDYYLTEMSQFSPVTDQPLQEGEEILENHPTVVNQER